MAVVAELLALLKLDDSNFKKGMKDSKKEADSFGSRMKAAGQNVTDFGNRMTMATAPVALGLGVAINESRRFDKSMANINAILGITGDEAADLRKELLNYGMASRQGPQKVAEAYYAIVSGVQDATTHMAILEASTNMADAGQANLTATTDALISTMNSYGFAAEDASLVSDVFTNTVAMGKLTMDELAAAMPQVTGLAASFGIEIEDLGSQMAFLTTQGFSAGNSATFLKSMITTLLNPTASLQTAINDLGYESGEAMLANLGLVGSYEALKKYNNGTFGGLITNQEAMAGAIGLTNDAYNEFNSTFGESIEGATARAKIIQDEARTWDDLGAKTQGLAIIVGDTLVPVLDSLLKETVLPLIDGIAGWMQQNPELSGQIMMITAGLVVLGPIISGVGAAVSFVSGVVGVLTTAWGAYTAASAAAAAGTGGLAASMAAAAGPIIAVGAAIAGVIAQVHEFNSTVGTAEDYARTELLDELQSGAVTRQDLDDASFKAVSSQFGGGLIGDVAARLTYSNFSNSIEPLEMRATGGGVAAGQMVRVNEDGGEYWTPDSSGEVIPLGDSRGGGSPVFHIYQQPGESGEQLAQRVAGLMVQRGLARA